MLTAIIVLIPGLAKAGGWARDAGQVYLRAGAAVFEGTAPFSQTDAAPLGEFESTAAEFYGEGGLGRGLELDASLRWVSNRYALLDGSERDNRGLEELETFLKWAPVSGSRALAFVVGARLALYERLSPVETLDGTPQRGPGGADILVGGAYGHSFYPLPAWFNVDLLHRLRVPGPSSGVLLRAELGGELAPVGAAALIEFQPAFGRELDVADDDPSPVPKVFGLGVKLFAHVIHGFGLSADAMWLPEIFNDGPGYRLGLSLTYDSTRGRI